MISARKQINGIKDDPTADDTWNELKEVLKDWKNEFDEDNSRDITIVQMQDTDIRFIFDSFMRIQEWVSADEFIKFSVKGLKDKSVEYLLNKICID